MKKNIMYSMILISVGIVLLLINTSKKTVLKEDALGMSWKSVKKFDLEGINITAYQQDNVLEYSIQRSDGIWNILTPIMIKAQQDKAITLANYFLNLSPISRFTNVSSDEFTSYGLTKPKIIVTGIFKNNRTNQFLVGNKTAVNNQYYVSENVDNSDVYLINHDQLEPFIQGVSYLINDNLITNPVDFVKNITFRNLNNELFVFTNNNEIWEQTQPEKNTTIDWGIRRFLLIVKDLRFNEKSVSFLLSKENFTKLKINTETSPMLRLDYKDDSFSEFYLGEKTQSGYPIYSSDLKLIAFCSVEDIESIFMIQIRDLMVQK